MKPVITYQQLVDAGASCGQLDTFRDLYGDSVVVTVAEAEKVAGKFCWVFAAVRLLDAAGLDAYLSDIRLARAEYERHALTRAEYDRVCAAAFANGYIAICNRRAA